MCFSNNRERQFLSLEVHYEPRENVLGHPEKRVQSPPVYFKNISNEQLENCLKIKRRDLIKRGIRQNCYVL